jgi:Fur family transcriptional regulator, peroxide stress response regulator
MRKNIYREKILKILKDNHLLNISEIHVFIPEADYSTIFRNIEHLLEDKKIKKIVLNKKNTAYELMIENHDHFVCNDCGDVQEIKISRANHEELEIEEITVRGRCKRCK